MGLSIFGRVKLQHRERIHVPFQKAITVFALFILYGVNGLTLIGFSDFQFVKSRIYTVVVSHHSFIHLTRDDDVFDVPACVQGGPPCGPQ